MSAAFVVFLVAWFAIFLTVFVAGAAIAQHLKERRAA